MRTAILRTGIALSALFLPAVAAAQVGNPLPRATGMGGSYTAIARGFGATAWNPAGLGMPDNPRASLALLPVVGTAGLDPITTGDVADFGGELLPHETRVEWLAAIRDAGGEAGTFGADVTYVAASLGRFAVSASSTVRGRVDVSPDVAELILFGNAGLTGEPGEFDLEGSEYDVAGTTTIAVSAALPLALTLGPLPGQRFAIGATVKHTIGNFLSMGREAGSALGADPLQVDVAFPMIATAFPDDAGIWDAGSLNNGTGWGLDVGAAWQGGIVSAGVVVHNLVNTFEWDLESLELRRGRAVWNADTSYTDFQETAPLSEAPRELLDRIDGLYTFSPVVAAGAAARVTPLLTLTADVRHALEDDLSVGARSHLGVGAELAVLPFLPIRAGLTKLSDGYQISGGLGLRLGPAQLSGAAAFREGELGSDAVGAFGLTFGVR